MSPSRFMLMLFQSKYLSKVIVLRFYLYWYIHIYIFSIVSEKRMMFTTKICIHWFPSYREILPAPQEQKVEISFLSGGCAKIQTTSSNHRLPNKVSVLNPPPPSLEAAQKNISQNVTTNSSLKSRLIPQIHPIPKETFRCLLLLIIHWSQHEIHH